MTDFYSFGFRGQLPTIETPLAPVQIAWNASIYRNDTSHYSDNELGDDLGRVREQGVKAAVEVSTGPLTVSASYKYTDSRFLDTTVLGNGVNAGRDLATNTITIKPGDTVPVQPQHTVKIGAAFAVTPQWVIGATLRGVSGSNYFGDEINYYPKMPGYFVASFNTSYRYDEHLEFFGILENAFDKQYAVLGALVVVQGNKFAQVSSVTDSRAWILGQPLSVYGGFKYKF
ncbi:outer membrane receptor protein involved in Fe transport [Rhodoblastus sphagnicola]|uniref:TonB-dependent receptor domain-containing protein n=1 Tax=Rhodoblastus sphagnicola TaxID=333368 RepID=UPI001304B8ED|nr:TonB-dependent receptor [Rhodoblastus sphagnicola]MBB4199849.1 outer membrane receptor protein involved in Fe transport [Rhodoblastus sphagnicola]